MIEIYSYYMNYKIISATKDMYFLLGGRYGLNANTTHIVDVLARLRSTLIQPS